MCIFFLYSGLKLFITNELELSRLYFIYICFLTKHMRRVFKRNFKRPSLVNLTPTEKNDINVRRPSGVHYLPIIIRSMRY